MTEMEEVYECVVKLEESYYSIMQENVACFDERNIALIIAKSRLYSCLARLERLLLQKS